MIARLIGGIGAASEWRALLIWLAAIGGVLPRRTRGPATLALAVLLSRAHGAGLAGVESAVRLSDEGNDRRFAIVAKHVDSAADELAARVGRLERGEFCAADLAFVALPDAEDVTT